MPSPPTTIELYEDRPSERTYLKMAAIISYSSAYSLLSTFYLRLRFGFADHCARLLYLLTYLYLLTLLTPPAFSGERLCNGTVSVRPSVCLSVMSIDSGSDVQVVAAGRVRAAVA